jgi:SAM-dependent methyltransferase
MKRRYDYLLGDSRTEGARLRRQAALWDPTTNALFDRLRLRPGMRALEIGPGRGSLHVELRRRLRGPVDAVERSSAFAKHLGALCAKDGHGEGRLWVRDLIDAPLPRAHYDLIFARWVFLFLPDVPAHLKKLAAALRPGGRLVVQDYLRDTMAMVPRPEEWDAFIGADRAFFATQGGDVNMGAKIPSMAKGAGLVVESITPTVKLARPGDAAWRWMTDYFLGVMDRYAGPAPFTKAAAASLRKQWVAAGESRSSVLVSPTVLDVVMRRPRR